MKRDEIRTMGFSPIPSGLMARPDITASEKVVLAFLIDSLRDNETCWPAPPAIAKGTGLSRRCVQRSIDHLRQLTIVEVVGHKKNNANEYRINLSSSAKMTLPDSSDTTDEKRQMCATGSVNCAPPVASNRRTNTRYISKDDSKESGASHPQPATAGKAAGAAEVVERHSPLADIPLNAKPPILNADGGYTSGTKCSTLTELTADKPEQMAEHVNTMGAEESTRSSLAAAPISAGAAPDDEVDPVWEAMNDPHQPDPQEFGVIGDPNEDYPDSPENAPGISSGASETPGDASGGPARPDAVAARSRTPQTTRKAATRTKMEKTSRHPEKSMSQEDKELICNSAQNMTNWLCRGIEGVKATTNEALAAIKPSPMDWHVHNGTFEQPRFELWTIPQIAAYYWMRVSYYREEHKIPLTLPMMGLLLRNIRSLDETMPRQTLWAYLHTIVFHFDLIKVMNKEFGSKFALGEKSLLHGVIQSTANTVMGLSDSDRKKEYRKWRLVEPG